MSRRERLWRVDGQRISRARPLSSLHLSYVCERQKKAGKGTLRETEHGLRIPSCTQSPSPGFSLVVRNWGRGAGQSRNLEVLGRKRERDGSIKLFGCGYVSIERDQNIRNVLKIKYSTINEGSVANWIEPTPFLLLSPHIPTRLPPHLTTYHSQCPPPVKRLSLPTTERMEAMPEPTPDIPTSTAPPLT